MTWLTNDPAIAKKLKAADVAFLAARDAARDLPLADKVAAYRAAKLTIDAAYKAILEATP